MSATLEEVTKKKKPYFPSLSTESRRRKYYRENFLFVQPRQIFLGSTVKTVKQKTRMLKHYGYYVPLKETLKSILQLPEYKEMLSKVAGEKSDDVYDGVFRTPPGSPLKQIHIATSFDEV